MRYLFIISIAALVLSVFEARADVNCTFVQDGTTYAVMAPAVSGTTVPVAKGYKFKAGLPFNEYNETEHGYFLSSDLVTFEVVDFKRLEQQVTECTKDDPYKSVFSYLAVQFRVSSPKKIFGSGTDLPVGEAMVWAMCTEKLVSRCESK
jgi:hypothetical protein